MSRQDRHRQLCDAQVVPEHVLSLYDSQLGWKKMVRFNTKIKLSSTIQSNHKRALNLCLKQCFPCKLYHMYRPTCEMQGGWKKRGYGAPVMNPRTSKFQLHKLLIKRRIPFHIQNNNLVGFKQISTWYFSSVPPFGKTLPSPFTDISPIYKSSYWVTFYPLCLLF